MFSKDLFLTGVLQAEHMEFMTTHVINSGSLGTWTSMCDSVYCMKFMTTHNVQNMLYRLESRTMDMLDNLGSLMHRLIYMAVHGEKKINLIILATKG